MADTESVSDGVTLFGFRQLLSVGEIWTFITTFTVLGCALAYFVAGLVACRVVRQRKYLQYLWLPPVSALFGGIIGFYSGSITGACVRACVRGGGEGGGWGSPGHALGQGVRAAVAAADD
jgi:hypothetical protein